MMLRSGAVPAENAVEMTQSTGYRANETAAMHDCVDPKSFEPGFHALASPRVTRSLSREATNRSKKINTEYAAAYPY